MVDDSDNATDVIDALVAVGYAVSRASHGLAGLVAVEEEEPILVILSWAMPFVDGGVFLTALHAGLATPPPVIALISSGVEPQVVQHVGVRAVLSKPVDAQALIREVRHIVDYGRHN